MADLTPPPNTSAARPQQIDNVAVLRHLRRMALAEAPPWLHADIAQRMAERLPVIKVRARRLLQWSAFLGGSNAVLAQAYPGAEQICVEPTAALRARSTQVTRPGWRQVLQRRAAVLVTAPDAVTAEPVDLVWANMALHMSADPPLTLSRWQAALAVDGFVMFSCLGPDSFVELRALYRKHGWGRPAPDWWDMHDIGDLMVEAGFADPVMDQERISLTWGEPEAMLRDLRALGGNLAPDRCAGLRGRAWRRALLAALEGLRGTDGRLRLSLEIVYGHAFKAAPKIRLGAEARVSLDDMRAMVRQPRRS